MATLISNIEITVSEMAYGNQMIRLKLDETQINFYGSYIGECPLSSLISLVAEIDVDIENENTPNDIQIRWFDEPGAFEMRVKYDGLIDDIAIRISDEDLFMDGTISNPYEEYHFVVSHEVFRNAVIKEASRVLKVYGLRGYNENWCDGIDNFPLSAFLILLGNKSKFDSDSDTYSSDFENEILLLKSIL